MAELEPAAEPRRGRIVVGIDGSEESDRALAWAAEEARLRDATLEVIHVWHFVTAGIYAVPVWAADPKQLEAGAKALVERQVAALGPAAEGLTIMTVTCEGPAAPSLTAAAKGADLLVVGSRGHGGFSGLLLGSVSQQVAHHAPCPVVLVRAEG